MKKVYRKNKKVIILSDSKELNKNELLLYSGLKNEDVIKIEQYDFYDATVSSFREYENSIYEIHLA